MQEIGGYFGFEQLVKKPYHHGMGFSSGRNALRYIIRKRNIKTIYLPVYLCDVIPVVCLKEKVEIKYYHIDSTFQPILEPTQEYVYIVNYYGQLSNAKLKILNQKYSNMIIDNTHSFFQESIPGMDTIYNCRKYFGVPDGAYLDTDLVKDDTMKRARVMKRMTHLVGRYELDAHSYYKDFKLADASFDDEEMLLMSKVTENMMGAIDYRLVHAIRHRNFDYLNQELKDINDLSIIQKTTFMYPFYCKEASYLREELMRHQIYIPILWPNVLKEGGINPNEYDYAQHILPLPMDQRYSLEDLKSMVEIIKQFIKRRREQTSGQI